MHVSTRRCSWADSRRRHPFVFAPFVVVRLSPVPAGIARPGVAGLTRSRLPLGRAGTVAGTNQTDNTNTNGYPYPSCVPIVDSEEPKSLTGPVFIRESEILPPICVEFHGLGANGYLVLRPEVHCHSEPGTRRGTDFPQYVLWVL